MHFTDWCKNLLSLSIILAVLTLLFSPIRASTTLAQVTPAFIRQVWVIRQEILPARASSGSSGCGLDYVPRSLWELGSQLAIREAARQDVALGGPCHFGERKR